MNIKMNKQFFYRQEGITEGDKKVNAVNSFSLDKVLATEQVGEEVLRVYLDDFHSEPKTVETPKKNGGKSEQVLMVDVCSTIYLIGNDMHRFWNATGMDLEIIPNETIVPQEIETV